MLKVVCLFLIVIDVLLFFVLLTPNRKLAQLKEDLRVLQVQVDGLERQIQEKDLIIEKLRARDPAVVESVARDKFGMAKQGETIYAVPRTETEAPREK
ncbi:MAG: septum formation initiator family protein [Oligosphaeraceae bacterium]